MFCLFYFLRGSPRINNNKKSVRALTSLKISVIVIVVIRIIWRDRAPTWVALKTEVSQPLTFTIVSFPKALVLLFFSPTTACFASIFTSVFVHVVDCFACCFSTIIR